MRERVNETWTSRHAERSVSISQIVKQCCEQTLLVRPFVPQGDGRIILNRISERDGGCKAVTFYWVV